MAINPKIYSVFKLYPTIKLVYLFGSRANKKTGPLSDYDFAFFLEEENPKKIFNIKLKLMTALSKVLKTDKIDVVILNNVESPELQYNIIKEGKLIFEKEPYRVLVEPKILSIYFDFKQILLKYGLTKA